MAGERVGQILDGRWHLDRLLDVGGTGAVYAATHRNANRVAIKVLHRKYVSDQDIKTRFLREGYAANRVGHPGAVIVLDDGETELGDVFLVMELLEGESLDARCGQGEKLDQLKLLPIIDRVLDVLAAAHSKGIIHRDVKPANLFLTGQGSVKVLDFGLARLLGSATGKTTVAGALLGTPSYMAPEQARGKSELIDARSDLWSVGATMFRLLTGRPVHVGATPAQRLLASMTCHAPSLGSVEASVAPSVIELVDRALSFQPNERFPDATAMQSSIRRAYAELTGSPVANVVELRIPPAGSHPVFDDGSASEVTSVTVHQKTADSPSIRVVIPQPAGGRLVYELEETIANSRELPEVGSISLVESTLIDESGQEPKHEPPGEAKAASENNGMVVNNSARGGVDGRE